MPRARNAPVPASPRTREAHLPTLTVVPDAPEVDEDEAPEPEPGTVVVGSIPTVVGDRHTEGKRWAPSGATVRGRQVTTSTDNPTKGEVWASLVPVEWEPVTLWDWAEPAGEEAATVRVVAGVGLVVGASLVGWMLATMPPGPAARFLLSLLLVVLGLAVVLGAGWLLRWERVMADPAGHRAPERDHFISRPATLGAVAVVVGWLVCLWGGVAGAPALLVGVVVVMVVVVMRTSAVEASRRAVELQRTGKPDAGEKVYATWRRMVAPPEKGASRRDVSPLVGSHLTEVRMLSDGGWTGTINLPVETDATWETVVKDLRRISKWFGVPAERIHVGPYRTGVGTHATITVHRADALAKPIQWARSLDRRGRVRIGWHADGRPCWWHLWHSGSGTVHALVAGSTRTGKSGLIQGLIMELLCAAHAFVILCDPKGGKSMIHMNDQVDHLAVEDDTIVEAIRGTFSILEARKRCEDLGAWSPSRAWPVVALVIDEATEVLGKPHLRDRVAEMVDTIARQGAGLGILLVLGTQTYIKESLGGVGVSSNLGNIASMRMDDLEARDRLTRMLGAGDLTLIPSGDAGRGRGITRSDPVQLRVEYTEPGQPGWDEFLKSKKPTALDPVSRRAWDLVVRPPVLEESS